jgi:hypothetical protein
MVRRSGDPPRLKTHPRLSFVDQTALLGRGIAGNVRAALATPGRPQLPRPGGTQDARHHHLNKAGTERAARLPGYGRAAPADSPSAAPGPPRCGSRSAGSARCRRA